jgi:hypothetical protein
VETPQRLLLGFQQANNKQWGSYISTMQVFLHGNVIFFPMIHWDIKVRDLEILYFVVKELINKENYEFFFHLKYYSQPPMNHENLWKPQ